MREKGNVFMAVTSFIVTIACGVMTMIQVNQNSRLGVILFGIGTLISLYFAWKFFSLIEDVDESEETEEDEDEEDDDEEDEETEEEEMQKAEEFKDEVKKEKADAIEYEEKKEWTNLIRLFCPQS